MLISKSNRPPLKSLKQRKWYILIFWLCMIGAVITTIATYYMFFYDAELFLLMILLTLNFLYRGQLYKDAFDGYDDWRRFKISKMDIAELAEIADIEDPVEKKRRKDELKIRSKEYDRLWEITWKLKLLNRKEELYMKKVNKKTARYGKKRKKLEEKLVPRCKGIKM